jgi:4-hydroxybenzoate polyprenyltransferase
MGIFSVVIALLKDTPDVIGDAKSDIKTFSVRFGVKPVLKICMLLLSVAYLSGIYLGLNSSSVHKVLILVSQNISTKHLIN